MNVADIREALKSAPIVGDTIELTGMSFIADEPFIYGAVNEDYIKSELEWYRSQSLSVKDIKPFTPRIWDLVSSRDGLINSNYGFLFYSEENCLQFVNIVKTLRADPESRQAIAIYTRPTMHVDAFRDGMHDFVCTNTVQYLIRNGELEVIVNMRSNDVVFGYRNDYAWQRYAQADVASSLGIKPGKMTWQVGSLHVYMRHWHLLSELNVRYRCNARVHFEGDVARRCETLTKEDGGTHDGDHTDGEASWGSTAATTGEKCHDWTLDSSEKAPHDLRTCILAVRESDGDHDGDHTDGVRTWNRSGRITS